MRTILALLALTSLGAGSAFAQDPVDVDSEHYTVMFENDQVRVLKIRYGPNEESVMHEHPAGVAVYLGDIRGQFTLPDGQVLELEGKAGDAEWTAAGAHLPKNLTDQPFELVLVELKTPQPGAE
ncbi:MAG TPA: cytoplasmic protein [Gemmatimonadota bacterium]|nr:cytoplasmic protein [Gemmatimonadota bacterium]